MDNKKKFLEEYKNLCKKYSLYIGVVDWDGQQAIEELTESTPDPFLDLEIT